MRLALPASLALLAALVLPIRSDAQPPPARARPRRVILFIWDGFGPNLLSLACLYRHLYEGRGRAVEPLALESLKQLGQTALVQPIPDIGQLVIESAGAV